ncbi:uncharacterized protein LOC129596566 [Paramacrobiotus metropolitanus]|uniref:uncharacterized protein LOC129596566 n=1 Tax=Paramacrobiotus metropolitanus TaxID=2943436 RepID=UPI002445B4D8|nr:uncharacterized protein LOC129596566 [Paramacrobiotus metropolitanus]
MEPATGRRAVAGAAAAPGGRRLGVVCRAVGGHGIDRLWLCGRRASATPYGTVKELVPDGQVRAPPTDAGLQERRVKKDDFVVRRCALPAGYWSEASAAVREIFQYEVNQRFHVQCTAVLSKTLRYLQWKSETRVTAQQVEDEYKNTVKHNDELGRTTITWKWLLRQQEAESAPQRKRKIPGSQPGSLPLPVELLLEVFRALDSIGRFRCRRVCDVWNALLTTDAYFPEVRVSNTPADYDGVLHYDHSLYWITVSVLKSFNSATKIAVFTGIELYEFSELTNLIWGMFQRAGNLSVVVLYKCNFSEEHGYVDSAVHCMAQQVVPDGSRGRILWRQCRLGDENITAAIAHHAVRGQTEGERQEELWELVEQNLVLKKPLYRTALAAWVADCVAQQRTKDIKWIIEVMRRYQWLDPRKSTTYRNRKWTSATLGSLDVSKVTTLTAAVLSESMDRSDE